MNANHLTPEQQRFFARNGYVVLQQMIPASCCDELVQETWKHLPTTWHPDAPSSWKGEVTDSCVSGDILYRGGHLKFQRRTYAQREEYDRYFGRNSVLGRTAQALIGAPLANMRQRGLYAIAPVDPEESIGRNAHHIESHAAQLIALAYLADVKPGGGGLRVWPGSHRDLYPALNSKLEYVSTPRFEAAYAKWTQLQPLELSGDRGDVVLIHHRLIHSPSENHSDRIRFGFLCDYMRADFRDLCQQVPSEDLWEDWPAMAALSAAERDAGPDVSLLPAPPRLRDAAPLPTHELARAKGAASTLARQRQPGDLWVVILDSHADMGTTRLMPSGRHLDQRQVQVSIDEQPLPSLCKFGFFGHVQPQADEVTLTASSLSSRLWLRVISTRLPVDESVLLYEAVIEPGVPLQAQLSDLLANARVGA
jgi:ectoine hydroxylase-related dioxygenase (phytanoyl-CoA dioxygenase family)